MVARQRRTAAAAVKVVVAGPFAAGKTTLIRAVSEIEVLSTEQGVSDDTRARKNETTVAMDFGRVTIDKELILYLFGTPGQDRFDFMWEILSEGMLGYILLLDGTRTDALDNASTILASFRRHANTPFVVALNRVDAVDPQQEQNVRTQLDLDPAVPVLACDATDRESVKEVLISLLLAVLASLAPVEVEA